MKSLLLENFCRELITFIIPSFSSLFQIWLNLVCKLQIFKQLVRDLKRQESGSLGNKQGFSI